MPSNTIEYQTKYYLKNKDKLKVYGNEKIYCVHCSCNTKRCNLTRHNQTAKHIRNAKIEKPEVIPEQPIGKRLQNEITVYNVLGYLKKLIPIEEYEEIEKKSQKMLDDIERDNLLKQNELQVSDEIPVETIIN